MKNNIHILEHEAEEYHCAMMVLDDLGIPRIDKKSNETYSIVGRIMLAFNHSRTPITTVDTITQGEQQNFIERWLQENRK